MKQLNLETYQTLKLIKTNYHKLPPQQYRTLKGQCLAGDVEGAEKGLLKILRKKANKV